jgi:CheY-like chemotaxis protein
LVYSAEPDPEGVSPPRNPWRVLVVDDDPLVQQSTRLALSDVEIGGRPLELIHANSASEAKSLLCADPNVDAVLLDIVMETAAAGLQLIPELRREPAHSNLRIIIRTGQPEQAQHDEVRAGKEIDGFLYKAQQTRAWLVAMLAEVLGGTRASGAAGTG